MIISNDRFLFYTNYFAMAAQSGVQSAASLFKAIDPVVRVNLNTFDVFDYGASARDSFIVNLRTSYEVIYGNQVSLRPMEAAFNALANHIQYFTGLNINDFLTDTGIKVNPIYASISGALGQAINKDNIEV